MVVYNSQNNDALGEEDGDNTIQTYCDAIKTAFDLNNTALALMDGQTIPCNELKITTLESLEVQYEYQSSVHKLLCNLRYFALYQRHLSHSNVFIQRLFFAEMLKAGNKYHLYDITSKLWI